MRILFIGKNVARPRFCFFKNLIDFEGLQTAADVELTEADKDRIGEILYKMIVVADGYEDKDYIEYDDEKIKAMTGDPRQILDLIAALLHKLE